MKLQKSTIVILSIALVAITGAVYYNVKPTPLSGFAQCLTDKGAKFYGAFWCPHCQEQKKLLGKAMNNINYIECSTPDGRAQTQVCKDAKIEGYPTWEFADKSRQSGKLSLQDLATKSGCALP